jgi:DNA polymerase I-like protein with 3'-5' exonuclease and polymerase domains
MAALFDLPSSRSNKGADVNVVNKITNKKSAPITIKGGGLIEKIASIKALVDRKLGKYKDEYIYFMAEDEQKFKDYIYAIKEKGDFSLDTETTGLNPISDKLVGMSLYTKGQKGLYIPIHHKSYVTGLEVEGQLDPKLIKEQLQILVDNKVKCKYYNASFDIRVVLNHLGVYVPAWYDAHLAAMCLNENEPHGLKTLHSKYVLDGQEDEFSFGQLFKDIPFDLIPVKCGYIYAARDAVDTDELADWQLPYLTESNPLCKEYGLEDVSKVFWNIEMPYVDVIVNMEQNGVLFDPEYTEKLSEKYHKILDENLDSFYKSLEPYKKDIEKYKTLYPDHKLSDPISVSSPVQLAILLYDIIGFDAGIDKKTNKKIRGTGEDIIKKFDSPVCKAILDYRGTEKLLSTYIDKMPEVALDDGRIHCKFNQYGAKTGRLSSEDPNMQNIPSHNKDIRKMFVASPGHVLLSGDFSQQEPRVMTAMCQDPEMIKAYKNGLDLYASIASIAFNTTYEECLEFKDGEYYADGDTRRSSAKSILLGILYGRGIASIAEQLHTTKEKAQVIQDKVFKEFPAIKQFEDDTLDMARELGFVTTFWGRKRRLPEMQLEEFEFAWAPGYGDVDPLSFDTEIVETEVPNNIKRKYLSQLHKAWGAKRREIVNSAKQEGIIIIDNGGKIADATRQCVNSRIQGSAADMSKIAGIKLFHNERLKELGFRMLIPIHDEYLVECPLENAKECAKIFSDTMCSAADDIHLPIKVDVAVSYKWKGETINLEDL